MKEYNTKKKAAEQQKPKAAPTPKAKEQSEPQNIAPSSGPSPEPHASLLANEQAALPINAEPVADIVTQLQRSYGNTYVQRLVAEVGEARIGAVPKSEEGEHLNPATQTAMEHALGQDLSAVRIHTDSQAQQAAEALDARAFTHGRDVYFGKGEYEPVSRSGQHLLAHELAHVVQQQGHEARTATDRVGQTRDGFEQAAEQAATAVLANQPAPALTQTPAPLIQREKKQEAPAIQRHGREITPLPANGVIDVAGRFSVAYTYNVVSGATYTPLTLVVPAGVAVAVVPLTDLSSGDYQVIDPGGTAARAVTISVSAHMRTLPKIQVTLTQGSFTYLVVFQFPQSSTTSEPGQE